MVDGGTTGLLLFWEIARDKARDTRPEPAPSSSL